MYILVSLLSMVFMILLFYEDDKAKGVIFGALSVFLGIGGVYLSIYEGAGTFSYVPLTFIIISILYSIYSIFIEINKKNDWSNHNDNEGE